jgi:hypothetical protein
MKTSKIATAQALHRLLPKIKRAAFFEILQQPQEVYAGVRYWFENSYQTPWKTRPNEAKRAAKAVALELIKEALETDQVDRNFVVDAARSNSELTALLL